MHYVVYIDILFGINVVFDYVILQMTRKMTSNPVRMAGIELASAVGGFYVCLYVLLPFRENQVFIVVTHVLISALMNGICFKSKSVKKFVRNLVMFYVSAAMMGGVIYMIYFNTGAGYYLQSGESLDCIWLAVYLTAGSVIVSAFIKVLMAVRGRGGVIYEVIVVNRGITKKFMGLLDTGNSLCDLSGNPVCIGSYKVLETLMDNDVKHAVKEYDHGSLEGGIVDGIRLIPYSSLGNENGLMPGVKMEKIIVKEGKNYNVTENAVFGIYDGVIGRNKGYDIILHPKVLSM